MDTLTGVLAPNYSENMNMSSITQTQQVIFRNIYAYTNACLHKMTTDEHMAMNLNERQKRNMRGFDGKKERGKRESYCSQIELHAKKSVQLFQFLFNLVLTC